MPRTASPPPWHAGIHKVNDVKALIDPEPGGKTKMTDHESSAKGNFALDGVAATMDFEYLVSFSSDASAAYICSSDSDMLVSADGSVNEIPIPRNIRAAFENPVDGSADFTLRVDA